MFLIISLAATLIPLTAEKFPLINRIPVGIPNVRDCTEEIRIFGVTPPTLRTASWVAHLGSGDEHHLIRHGNDKGNIEKRVVQLFSGTHTRIDKVERSLGKKKWADAGRLVTAYLGHRWTCTGEVVDGTASVRVTYFCVEGTDIGLGYDSAGGLLVRVRQRSE